MSAPLYGLVAIFETPEAFLAGLRTVTRSGYSRVEANVPFAVEGMDECLPGRPSPVARVMLLAGVAGAVGGYFLQWFAARDYPLNVGGRPLHSWPAFIPVTFELTVLTAAVLGVGTLLWLTGLPRLHHPLFHFAGFERMSQDRFLVCIRANDPRFDPSRVRELLASLAPESIMEVRR